MGGKACDQGPLATEQPPPRPSQATSQTPQTLFLGSQGPHTYIGCWEVSSCEPM